MSSTPRIFSYATFNLSALVNLAEKLRCARCFCDDSQKPMSGDWIFRSPRPDNGFSEHTTLNMIESEVASIKFSKLNSIPVVEVKSHCGSRSNEIGVPFILATRAPGFSISSKFIWDPYPEGMKQPRCPLPCLPRVAKEKIMRQLGMITSQILNRPFDQIGSLRERDGEYHIEECLSPALTWSSRDSFDDIARGPFNNDKEYYESLLSALHRHAEKLPLEYHVFLAPVPKPKEFPSLSSYLSAVRLWNDFVTIGSKIDSSKNRLDYIAVAHLLRNIIPSISTNQQKYYLKPPDFSLSDIFIGDDYNITCIIDWTSCFTVPLSMLLIAPSFSHPRDGVDTAMIPIFKDSVIRYSSQMNKEVSNPLFWDLAQKSQLFMKLIDLDGLPDYFHFVELYTSVYTDTDETDVRRYFNTLREDDVFVGQARMLLKDDLPASEIQKQEKEYFAHSPSGAEALARKLTEDADLDREFVAIADYGNKY
ncbi:hypothetical protein B0J14DRAFT_183036 [Halenospora varia]|nr:hypothetical protein B0J14DRAFT_183036 [Halenospora varia]